MKILDNTIGKAGKFLPYLVCILGIQLNEIVAATDYSDIEIRTLEINVKALSSKDIIGNRDGYKTLSEARPTNKYYKEKFKYYDNKLRALTSSYSPNKTLQVKQTNDTDDFWEQDDLEDKHIATGNSDNISDDFWNNDDDQQRLAKITQDRKVDIAEQKQKLANEQQRQREAEDAKAALRRAEKAMQRQIAREEKLRKKREAAENHQYAMDIVNTINNEFRKGAHEIAAINREFEQQQAENARISREISAAKRRVAQAEAKQREAERSREQQNAENNRTAAQRQKDFQAATKKPTQRKGLMLKGTVQLPSSRMTTDTGSTVSNNNSYESKKFQTGCLGHPTTGLAPRSGAVARQSINCQQKEPPKTIAHNDIRTNSNNNSGGNTNGTSGSEYGGNPGGDLSGNGNSGGGYNSDNWGESASDNSGDISPKYVWMKDIAVGTSWGTSEPTKEKALNWMKDYSGNNNLGAACTKRFGYTSGKVVMEIYNIKWKEEKSGNDTRWKAKAFANGYCQLNSSNSGYKNVRWCAHETRGQEQCAIHEPR